MPKYSQKNAPYAINTVLGEDVMLLRQATISETLFRDFTADLTLVSEKDDVDFDKLLGSNVTIRANYGKDGKSRFFNGFISALGQMDVRLNGLSMYSATVVSWTWMLNRYHDCRMFQDMSIPAIIKKVFSSRGFSNYKMSLKEADYPKREYTVQYNETDYAFIHRLMEDAGIYYYFEHENGKHTMVLCDAPANHVAMEEKGPIPLRVLGSGHETYLEIHNWQHKRLVTPSVFETTDYNFLKPKTDLLASAEGTRKHPLGNGSVFEYPGEYLEVAEGKKLAKLRIERYDAFHQNVSGVTGVVTLACGRTFKLSEHPRKDQNDEYLVTASQIVIKAAELGSHSGEGASYIHDFLAMPAKIPFRPVQRTPRPSIHGVQPAMVVGKDGEEIWTDEHGRVKVKFFWDREHEAKEDASCWVRVSQPWAGKNFGFQFLPRVGQEVLVEFVNGDPDRPIVTGRMYNAENKHPHPLPAEKTRSTIKSSSSKGGEGYNQITLEDKKDKEQIFVHAEKDFHVWVKNETRYLSQKDTHIIIEQDLLEKIDRDHQRHVLAESYQEIDKDYHTWIKGNEFRTIDKNLDLTVGGNVETKIDGTESIEVAKKLSIKGDIIVLEGASNITLKVGSSTIAIDSSSITIETGTLEIKTTDTKIEAKANIEMKATANIKAEATANAEIKGTAGLKLESAAMAEMKSPMTTVKGDGMLTLKGGVTMIN